MRTAITVLLLTLASAALADDDPPKPLPFACRSWFYAEVKDLLLPGDVVYAIASRDAPRPAQRGDGPPKGVWNPEKFKQAIQELLTVHAPGVRKSLVLSSYADLEREIGNIPKQIDMVSYNSEGGMTPREELYDLATYVPKFARLAHDHGFKMGWGPTHHMLTRRPELFELAEHVDSMGLQHQRPLQNEGLAAFVELTRERYAKIKGINEDCEVNVQVVLERTPAPQAIEAFRAVKDCVDRVGIWTMRDREGLRAVLEGLRDLRQGR
jgi:hypothetical protein